MTATKTETVTAATSKVFSVTDLASHYTESDAWVAIRGKVYDITKFISRHPGGRDVLLISAGKDATTVFETYHSLDEEKAKKVLSKFCIGTLSSSDVPQFQESGEMWDEMRDVRLFSSSVSFMMETTVLDFAKTEGHCDA